MGQICIIRLFLWCSMYQKEVKILENSSVYSALTDILVLRADCEYLQR